MSRIMRKPDFCLCKNKDADQLCSNCTADQRICFRCSDRTIPLLPLPKISRFFFSYTVQAGMCLTWSEIQKVGFLASRLKLEMPRENLSLYFPITSDKNHATHPQRMARGLKFRGKVVKIKNVVS